jgi:hypothetical protein
VTDAKMGQFDGIIGKQFFEKYGAVLDFEKNEMRINGHAIPFLTTIPVRNCGEKDIDNSEATEESNQLYAFFNEAQASVQEQIRLRAGRHTIIPSWTQALLQVAVDKGYAEKTVIVEPDILYN